MNSLKTLIITNVKEEYPPMIEMLTNRKTEDLVISNSLDEMSIHPDNSMIRDIIYSLNTIKIKEIYVIGEINKEPLILKHHLSKIDNTNLPKEASNWLIETPPMISIIKNNIKYIKEHPLIPHSITISGILVNRNTGDLEEIS
ncbi:hypothetical protein RZN25_14950 [Bacillaceae bacterium S4-13-56]